MTAKERLQARQKDIVPIFDKDELIAYTIRRVKEEKLVIRQLALALDVNYIGLCNMMRGDQDLPVKTMERILWIVDGDSCPYKWVSKYDSLFHPERPVDEDTNKDKTMTPDTFLKIYPEVTYEETPNEWLVYVGNDEALTYSKKKYELIDALKESVK